MAQKFTSPVGKVRFSNVFEPRAYMDDPAGKKKYSVSVEFEGKEAKDFRQFLLEIGKSAVLKEGKLRVSFSRGEKMGAPKLVDTNGVELTQERIGKWLRNDSEVVIQFTAFEYAQGVGLRLEAIKVVKLVEGMKSPSLKPVEVNPGEVDQSFLDAFL